MALGTARTGGMGVSALAMLAALAATCPRCAAQRCSLPANVTNPPESARMYSSTHNNAAPGTLLARSTLGSAQAWGPSSNVIGQWMQIDLGTAKRVAGIVTQGRADSDQWVQSYKVQYSTDGITFTEVASTTFVGNTDRNSKVTATLPRTVQARYVRLLPQSWRAYMCMRAGVIEAGCPPPSPTPLIHATCSLIEEEINPPEKSRQYSSTHNGAAPGTGYAKSNIDSVYAWVSGSVSNLQWMEMDLGSMFNVTKIITRGRYDSNQWVKSYKVQYSTDGVVFTEIASTTFIANADRHTKAYAVLPTTVLAQYVRILTVEC